MRMYRHIIHEMQQDQSGKMQRTPVEGHWNRANPTNIKFIHLQMLLHEIRRSICFTDLKTLDRIAMKLTDKYVSV